MFLAGWKTPPAEWHDGSHNGGMSDADYAFWNSILAVRGEVNRALEIARGEKIIGASLEARSSITPVPIRPRRRGERRSLRTFPGVPLRPGSLAFDPRPRCLSTSPDAFQLHPDIIARMDPRPQGVRGGVRV